MKKIAYVLLALLVCATFIGTASAFTYSSNATVDPSGSLSPGDDITAKMTIRISGTESIKNYNIYLSTPLDEATWALSIYASDGSGTPGDVALSNPVYQGKIATISGYTLDYPNGAYLSIVLSGKVSSASSGKSINVIKIDQSKTSGGEAVSSYTSLVQKVYNKDDFTGMITSTQEQITSLESRLTTYTSYGIDVSDVTKNLQSAKTSLAAAKTAGTSNIAVASKNLEAATTSLSAAEKSLSHAGLTTINKNINNVSAISEKLSEMGWDSNKVTNLKSDNTNINTDVMRYESTGSPNVDEILKDSEELVSTAREYMESATTSPLAAVGSVLPIIIVIVVAVVVVFGAIIFIRKRKGGFDELG